MLLIFRNALPLRGNWRHVILDHLLVCAPRFFWPGPAYLVLFMFAAPPPLPWTLPLLYPCGKQK